MFAQNEVFGMFDQNKVVGLFAVWAVRQVLNFSVRCSVYPDMSTKSEKRRKNLDWV